MVGELALSDRGLAAEGQRVVGADRVETSIDLGVDAADEEARDAGDHGQVRSRIRRQAFEAGEVGLDHRRVAVEAEDQRDVDASTLGDHLLDRGETLLGSGDLDHQISTVDLLVQASRQLISVPGPSWASPGSTSTLT